MVPDRRASAIALWGARSKPVALVMIAALAGAILTPAAISASSPGPAVQATTPASVTGLMAARFRAFGNNAGQRRIYVGVPDLGVGANRHEITPSYVYSPAANQVTFAFDPTALGGAAVSASMTNTNGSWSPSPFVLPSQPLRPDANYLAIRLRTAAASTQVATLQNVTLTPAGGGAIALGSFSATGADLTWLVVDPDPSSAPALFANGFSLTGDLVLTNGIPAFANCSEGCKLDLIVGVLPTDMQAVTTAPATAVTGANVTVWGTCTNNGIPAGSGAPPPILAAQARAPTCALSGLPPGATQACLPNPIPDPLVEGATITCTSTFAAPAPGTLNVTTTAGTDTDDPTPSNDSDTKAISINAPPSVDLSVMKSGPVRVNAGQTITYDLALANAGPSAAGGATFVDVVAAGVTGLTASCGSESGGAACGMLDVTGNRVSGTVPTLPAGGGVVITIRGTAPAGGTIDNSASVSAPGGTVDPDSSNDTSATVTTTVDPVLPDASMGSPDDAGTRAERFGGLIALLAALVLGVAAWHRARVRGN